MLREIRWLLESVVNGFWTSNNMFYACGAGLCNTVSWDIFQAKGLANSGKTGHLCGWEGHPELQ